MSSDRRSRKRSADSIRGHSQKSRKRRGSRSPLSKTHGVKANYPKPRWFSSAVSELWEEVKSLNPRASSRKVSLFEDILLKYLQYEKWELFSKPALSSRDREFFRTVYLEAFCTFFFDTDPLSTLDLKTASLMAQKPPALENPETSSPTEPKPEPKTEPKPEPAEKLAIAPAPALEKTDSPPKTTTPATASAPAKTTSTEPKKAEDPPAPVILPEPVSDPESSPPLTTAASLPMPEDEEEDSDESRASDTGLAPGLPLPTSADEKDSVSGAAKSDEKESGKSAAKSDEKGSTEVKKEQSKPSVDLTNSPPKEEDSKKEDDGPLIFQVVKTPRNTGSSGDESEESSEDEIPESPEKPKPKKSGSILDRLSSLITGPADLPPDRPEAAVKIEETKEVPKPAPKTTQAQDQAAKMRNQSRDRLHTQRKLMLFLDIDHTLVHATKDPRARNVARHPQLGPNIKEIHFKNQYGCPYWIAERPGLYPYLARVAELYNIVLYTMGSRAYAECVCKIVDPTSELIRNRIISRDDRYDKNLVDEKHRPIKSIQEFFPLFKETAMIVDDTTMVWTDPEDVYKVTKYLFWGADSAGRHAGQSSEQEGLNWDVNRMQTLYKRDTDLPDCLKLLEAVHKRYFEQVDKGQFPSAPGLMRSLQQFPQRGGHGGRD